MSEVDVGSGGGEFFTLTNQKTQWGQNLVVMIAIAMNPFLTQGSSPQFVGEVRL